MKPTKLAVQGPAGDWLFRQGELVLGPVKGDQLVAKLYAGEIHGETEVTPLGENSFRRLRDVDGLKLHLAKAEAKHRVDKVAKTAERVAVQQRNVKISGVAVVAVLVAAGLMVGARYLVIHNPFKDANQLAFADISVEPPEIGLARSRGTEELVAYPADGVRAKKPAGGLARATPAGGKAVASARASTAGTTTDADGFESANFDREAINSVVKKNQTTLYTCFREQAKRTPGLAERIPLEFAIGNDGHVAKLWVDNPKFKEGDLASCLFGQLQKWPFKTFEGERPTVRLAFNIGKPS